MRAAWTRAGVRTAGFTDGQARAPKSGLPRGPDDRDRDPPHTHTFVPVMAEGETDGRLEDAQGRAGGGVAPSERSQGRCARWASCGVCAHVHVHLYLRTHRAWASAGQSEGCRHVGACVDTKSSPRPCLM